MATGYPYFTIESASGGYRAHFYGANDRLVWWTEVYTTKQNALHAIQFAQNHAATAPIYDQSRR
jgi:uncharacterized protein YegP (UPF0339 family)